MKVCIKCNVEKPLECFNKRRNECKTCRSLIRREWYRANRDYALKYKKAYAAANADTIRLQKKQYNQENADKIRAYNKKRYYEKQTYNIERVINYTTERLKTDVVYRLKFNIRSRVRAAINSRKAVKNQSVITALGCTANELKQHLEQLFTPEMTWGNYGSYWHVDHVLPLASFNLTEPVDFNKACHFTNLQPLEAKENIRKSNKIIML